MIELWFSTPIYSNVINNFETIQNEINIAYEDLTNKNIFAKNPTWSSFTHSLSDIKFNKNLIKDYALENFEKELMVHIRNYVSPALVTNKFKIKQSWMTLTKKGEYAHMHSHETADVAGVYYFKTNGKDGALFFENPNMLMNSSYIFQDLPIVDRTEYAPGIGNLILFPGALLHGTKENTTDNDRISISFNVFFER